MTIAIENPPDGGEYRVFNQFEEVYDLTVLTQKVRDAAVELGLEVTVRNTENPRMEPEEQCCNPDHRHLIDLDYEPSRSIDEELRHMLRDLLRFRNRIESKKHALVPDIFWDGSRRKVTYL
jgi:nucleoside-diphosphate-sugar epimerase